MRESDWGDGGWLRSKNGFQFDIRMGLAAPAMIQQGRCTSAAPRNSAGKTMTCFPPQCPSSSSSEGHTNVRGPRNLTGPSGTCR